MIDLKSEKIVLEVQELVRGINTVKDEVDIYCELMKQMILSSSGKN